MRRELLGESIVPAGKSIVRVRECRATLSVLGETPGESIVPVLPRAETPGKSIVPLLPHAETPGESIVPLLPRVETPGESIVPVLLHVETPGESIVRNDRLAEHRLARRDGNDRLAERNDRLAETPDELVDDLSFFAETLSSFAETLSSFAEARFALPPSVFLLLFRLLTEQGTPRAHSRRPFPVA